MACIRFLSRMGFSGIFLVFAALAPLAAAAEPGRHDFMPHPGEHGPVPDSIQVPPRYFLGSSIFMLGHFLPGNPDPLYFIQLNAGWRVSRRDVLSVELKTRRYEKAPGIYGPFMVATMAVPQDKGHVRDIGLGLAYQRFVWRGAYAALHALNALQAYARNGESAGNGYALFMTYRAGYHVEFGTHFFLEPSVGLAHRPVRTNVPSDFRVEDGYGSNRFRLEPGLYFGYEF